MHEKCTRGGSFFLVFVGIGIRNGKMPLSEANLGTTKRRVEKLAFLLKSI